MDKQEKQFKRMVLAYLHDPPHKVLDLAEHEEFARSFIRAVWIDGPEGSEDLRLEREKESGNLYPWETTPDHAAAAADRVILPNRFAGAGGCFAAPGNHKGIVKHPLGAGERVIECPATAARAEEELQGSFGGIKAASWREFFFLLWRRWREESVAIDPALGVLPADSRIPDHSIWLHMDLTAAFEVCRESGGARLEPAFLLFQLGPVQEFIAAARSTRDLWSGSYLISWLTGCAIKAVTDEVGPASVIFPALRGLGIFDAVNREFFEKVKYQGKHGRLDTLWQRLYGTAEGEKDPAKSLFYPTIPNRFLALVPASRAEELARRAEQAVHEELKRIGDHCFRQLGTLANRDISAWRPRWEKQLELMPQITWQTLPFYEDLDAALAALEKMDPGQAARMREARVLAEAIIPEKERDGRYYRCCSRCGEYPDRCTHPDKRWKLNRPEFAWGANFAEVSLRLAARRNTRDFAAFVTDDHQDGAPKDMLTGKEELIGDEAFWKQKSDVFKDNEGPYGALNIIKRLWCDPHCGYLVKALGVSESRFQSFLRFNSTPELAGNDGYFAILAMDGDEMGKWISGEKTPGFLEQLRGNTREYFERLGVTPELRRQVTPGYHLQFSEALANFASKLAGWIVEEHNGCLIYAGGDDVLAALPAKNALDCAEALRNAFHGENGWQNGILVPGCRAELSCGIAIAHAHDPLQQVVAEARRAESRAKHEYGRSAFAVSLIKRGGETIHWGANWDDEALPLFRSFRAMREDDLASGRFPYMLAGLLAPYRLEAGEGSFAPEFHPREVIACELEQVLTNQMKIRTPDDLRRRDELRRLCLTYLDALDAKKRWGDFDKLFLTEAFIWRDRSGEGKGGKEA